MGENESVIIASIAETNKKLGEVIGELRVISEQHERRITMLEDERTKKAESGWLNASRLPWLIIAILAVVIATLTKADISMLFH